jgi:hypothetical protein
VFQLKDINGQAIVVDGTWIDKLDWAGNSKAHIPASRYAGTEVKETSRRKKLLFGEKEELLQVIVNAGTFLSLMVRAEQREDVDRLVAALERAHDESGY